MTCQRGAVGRSFVRSGVVAFGANGTNHTSKGHDSIRVFFVYFFFAGLERVGIIALEWGRVMQGEQEDDDN